MAAIQLPNSNGLSTTFFGSSVKTQSSQFVCLQMPSKAGYPSVLCGRGDKRTAKGKRFRHSHGNSRPKNSSKGRGLPPTPLPARTTPKKDAAGTEDLIEIKLGD